MRKYDQYNGVSEIINAIRKLADKNIQQEIDDDRADDGFEPDPLGPYLPYLEELSPQLKKDLSKVEFDWENYNSGTDLIDASWYHNQKDIFGYSKDIMGPHNQMGSQGVSWIGCAAGGDWEQPVFFMLYMDQGQVRAWIPKDGNCWNHTTKQAFGNDEDADIADIKKQLQKVYPELVEDGDDDLMYEYVDSLKDSNKIRKGIQEHFEARPHIIPV